MLLTSRSLIVEIGLLGVDSPSLSTPVPSISLHITPIPTTEASQIDTQCVYEHTFVVGRTQRG